jgi:hypothetical protein
MRGMRYGAVLCHSIMFYSYSQLFKLFLLYFFHEQLSHNWTKKRNKVHNREERGNNLTEEGNDNITFHDEQHSTVLRRRNKPPFKGIVSRDFRSYSRDSLLGQTTSALLENSTRNRLYFKK